MKDYLDYIEESTNVVKSKEQAIKADIDFIPYLVIWSFNMIVSWSFFLEGITEAQAGAFQWLVLPLTTIVVSL